MCGRTTITASEKVIEVRLGAKFEPDEASQLLLPNYNVTPTTIQPAVTNEDQHVLSLLRWGLIPFWAKDRKIAYKLINARIETVAEKPAFKHALRQRRCLIPMDGYYEWMTTGKHKQPYRIVTKDQSLFTCAGLWEEWRDPTSGEVYNTYTIITQPSTGHLSAIHNRMPSILLPHQERLWLDGSLSSNDHLSLLAPYPDEQLDAYPVSAAVGNIKNNYRDLIEKIDPPQREEGVQGSLF